VGWKKEFGVPGRGSDGFEEGESGRQLLSWKLGDVKYMVSCVYDRRVVDTI
jgi:hypothetical protein